MFRKEIIVEANSYIELAGRKSGEKELLALTMRGQGVAGQTTLASIALTADEIRTLSGQLTEWLATLTK